MVKRIFTGKHGTSETVKIGEGQFSLYCQQLQRFSGLYLISDGDKLKLRIKNYE